VTYDYSYLELGLAESVQAGAAAIPGQMAEIDAAWAAGAPPAEIARLHEELATLAESTARCALEVVNAIRLHEADATGR
jgi:hypothetical protein